MDRRRAIARAIGLAAFGLVAMGGCAAPATGGPPTAPSPDPTRAWLAQGRAVYERECAGCHGLKGEGQPGWAVPRPDGSLLAPPHDATGHTWHHADAELLRIVAEGGKIYSPLSSMPGYKDKLSEADMRATLAYIKSMWGPRERSWQAAVSTQWAASAPQSATVTPTP